MLVSVICAVQFNKACLIICCKMRFSVQLGCPHRSDQFSSAVAQSGRRTTLILRVFLARKIRAQKVRDACCMELSFNNDSALFYD